MFFIEVKSLAGSNYVGASDILAVQHNDTQRGSVIMPGGVTLPCSESAKDVAVRVEAALVAAEEKPSDRS